MLQLIGLFLIILALKLVITNNSPLVQSVFNVLMPQQDRNFASF